MATRAMGEKGLEPCPICGARGGAHVAEVTNSYVTSSGTRYAAVCSVRQVLEGGGRMEEKDWRLELIALIVLLAFIAFMWAGVAQ